MRAQVLRARCRVRERIGALDLAGQVAAAELQRALQAARHGAAEAAQRGQRGRFELEQAPQAAVADEQLASQLHGILAAPAGTEEQGQQFGIRQRRRAARQHFFARTFGGGPIANAHRGS